MDNYNNGLTVEVNKHNEQLISIKDFSGNINIAENKWDLLFGYLNAHSNTAYFEGSRAIDYDNQLKQTLEYTLENFEVISNVEVQVFGRVKSSALLVSRRRMSNLWDYYECPSLIFGSQEQQTNVLKLLRERATTYFEILRRLSKAYILFRNVEHDVLWVAKSEDAEFPYKMI